MLKISIRHAMVSAVGPSMLEIDTEVSPQELLCLYGPSGAGKTTLLRILAGLIKPDFGRIEFDDAVWFDSQTGTNLKTRDRNVGFMFQDYALFPNMSVQGNILFAQKKKDRAAADELIELFNLQAFVGQKPHQLSGGQKQRVALARALAAKPALLMLDEPLSALDSEMRTSLQDEIRKTHQRLSSITIMVSHDIAEVKRLASSVLMIRNGKVMEAGCPENLHFGNEPTEW